MLQMIKAARATPTATAKAKTPTKARSMVNRSRGIQGAAHTLITRVPGVGSNWWTPMVTEVKPGGQA
jgi:hypothetical protein